ncbi:MAG: hypothetical protein AB7N76_01570 [Planctomycetota bacterium]
MRQALIAGVVGLVFVVGIGVGATLMQPTAPPVSPPVVAAAPVTAPSRGILAPPPPPPSAGPSAAPSAGPSAAPSAAPSKAPERRLDEPYRGPDAPPPPPPPPPSAEGLEEAQRIQRDLAARGKRPNGKVTTLVYPEDPEEAAKLEQARTDRWARRLQYENDIRIKQLRASVGLSPEQEEELRKILAAEFEARMELVSQHSKKQLSDVSFDEKVKENVETARVKVKALLSEQQYAKYAELKPREQVLRDDVK